jgi:thymidylate synthase (FAD)
MNPPESTAILIQDVIKKGHHSVLEHATAGFKIEGMSRVCSHEIVRHRLFSFSQESQRYVNYCEKPATNQPGIKGRPRKKTKDYSYITPLDMAEMDDDLLDLDPYSGEHSFTYHDVVDLCYKYYEFLLSKGINPEDARYILPNATCTDLHISGNLRVWRHFLYLRCHPRAAWEIRYIANEIKDILKEKFSNVFFDFPIGQLTEEDYKGIIIT